MNVTESFNLLSSLAEIAGIFIGFGASIVLSSPRDEDRCCCRGEQCGRKGNPRVSPFGGSVAWDGEAEEHWDADASDTLWHFETDLDAESAAGEGHLPVWLEVPRP